jgi:hypothetical protein
MGTLLTFTRQGAAKPSTPPAGGASIIIFPGVRYERPTPDQPDGTASTGRARKTRTS